MDKRNLYNRVKNKVKRGLDHVQKTKETGCRYRISYVGPDCSREGYSDLLRKDILHGKVTSVQGKGWKYEENYWYINQCPHCLLPNRFEKKNCEFYGWYMRKEIDKCRVWYCTDGNWHTQAELEKGSQFRRYCFSDRESISLLPINSGDEIFLVAQWKKCLTEDTLYNERYSIYYNGNGDEQEQYSEWLRQGLIRGKLSVTPKKAHEFKEAYAFENSENTVLLKNGFLKEGYMFAGWQARKQVKGVWKWYCTDGTWRAAKEMNKNSALRKYCFADGEAIGYLPMEEGDKIIMSAFWEEIKKEEIPAEY